MGATFPKTRWQNGQADVGSLDPMSEMEGEPVIGGPLTLAAARRLAADIMRQRALGKDVICDHVTAKRRRKADYEQRAAQSFAAVARRFIEEYAKPQLRSWADECAAARALSRALGAGEGWPRRALARQTIGEITPDDIHDLVDEIRSKGTPGLKVRTAMSDCAARVALLRSRSFSAGQFSSGSQSLIRATGVWKPAAGPARERVLTDSEIKWLWRAAGDLGEPFGPALRLLLLTGQRRGEVGGMR